MIKSGSHEGFDFFGLGESNPSLEFECYKPLKISQNPATALLYSCSVEEWIGYTESFPIADGLNRCTRILARVCDHAVKLDGEGFNKPDAGKGHAIASTDIRKILSRQQMLVWAKTLIKYKGQLSGHGINYPDCLWDGV